MANNVMAVDIEGGSYDMVGTMWWTNELNAADGSQPVGSPWAIPNVPLAVGNNRIVVTAEDSGGFPSSSEVIINRRGSPQTYYVSTNGADAYPYTNWVMAARVIQDAVDAAVSGDLVMVSNGVYSAGGRNAPGYDLTNRVYLSKAVTVQSVNGPSNTIIAGTSPHGDAAARCAYLTNGAVLSGFTLTNGHTVIIASQPFDRYGGGAFLNSGGTVTNCIVTGCEAYHSGGGVFCARGGTVDNCEVDGNTAVHYNGGGVYCYYGGYVWESRIRNNYGDSAGGGIYFSNSGTVSRCVIQDNLAGENGGGAYGGGGRLYNCLVAGNIASNQGGGIWGQDLGAIANCTLINNEALTGEAGGMRLNQSGPVYNCIVYSNRAPSYPNIRDVASSTFDFNCTTPSIGSNCITNEPLLRNMAGGDYRLDYLSPCRDAGNSGYAAGNEDLAGETRIQNGTVDLGAYEYPQGRDPGDSPVHYVWTNSPAPNWPYTNWATAGRVLQEVVDAADSADTVIAENGIYDTGGSVTPGATLTNRVVITNTITLMSIGGPEGASIVGASDNGTNGPAAVRCVFIDNGGLIKGFTLTNGHTDVTGADHQRAGGGLFLYDGTASNCWITDNRGYRGAGLCLSYGTGMVFDCTIERNRAENWGGGVMITGDDGLLDRCRISDNEASDGGGLYLYHGGTVRNALVVRNTASNKGGGIVFDSWGLAENSTIANNSAGSHGGGIRFLGSGTSLNCIVVGNIAGINGTNYIFDGGGEMTHVCTTPDPGGTGSITNDPLFANADYELSPASFCINSGTNQLWMVGARDLEESTRIKGDGVDMGCYEHASVHSGVSPIHYASVTGNDIWPYTNWADAAHAIQDAVETADADEAVHVAEGVYDIGSAVTPGYFLASRVMIDKPLTLLGVNGPSNTVIVGRSHAGGFGSNAVRGIYIGTNAFVSGFTVSNGFTRGWLDEQYYLEKSGGGIYMRSGAVVSNVIVRNCQAWFGGGGVYVSAATLTCSVVQNNYCDQYGGGIYGGYVTDCAILDNEAGLHGGGVYEYDDTLEFCTIADNHAGSRGGGISFDMSQNGRAVNCLVKGNTAMHRGDAVQIQSSTLEHCTIVSNNGGNGPIYGALEGTIRNCIIVGNDGEVGDNYSRIEFTCTDDATVPAGTGNITNNPQFVDAASGDYQLLATSSCIDAATNLAEVTVDFNRLWRPLDGDADGTNTADMGCYELLNPVADSDGDMMTDGWENNHNLDPSDPSDASDLSDADPYDNVSEFIADTDPWDSNSLLQIMGTSHTNSHIVRFSCTNSRIYTLFYITNLVTGDLRAVPGQAGITGEADGEMSLTDPADAEQISYAVGVSVP